MKKKKEYITGSRLYILLLVLNTKYICIRYYGLKCQNIRGRNSLVSNLSQLFQKNISQQRFLYVKQTQE